MTIDFSIDGIRIEPEHGHWKLSKSGYAMRCDSGGLNEAIPEFKKWVKEKELARCHSRYFYTSK